MIEITQEKIDLAKEKIENHLRDLGIKNNFSFLEVLQKEDNWIFCYEIANPSFQSIIQVSYDFIKEEQKDSSQASFSWMDYKKITE